MAALGKMNGLRWHCQGYHCEAGCHQGADNEWCQVGNLTFPLICLSKQETIMPKPTEGTWAKDDLRRAFVAGVEWAYTSKESTLHPIHRQEAEIEAKKRYISGYLNALIAFIRRA